MLLHFPSNALQQGLAGGLYEEHLGSAEGLIEEYADVAEDLRVFRHVGFFVSCGGNPPTEGFLFMEVND